MVNKERRIQKLRSKVISTIPEICVERARLITEAYRETEELPMIIRRAKALEKILEEMTIYIGPGELIVGNQASKVRAAPIFSEFSIDWIEEELDEFSKRPQEKFLISEEAKGQLKEVLGYWKGKTHCDRVNSLISLSLPDTLFKAWDPQTGSLNQVIAKRQRIFDGDGHIIANYEKVLRKGLNGIIEEVQEELNSLDLTKPETLQKILFLQAAGISCRATIKFANRFAKEARRLANKEKSSMRRAELKKIAQMCEWVPANPARTFWEALQSYWLVHLIIQIESNGHSISFGRFDQYLYPFYKKDIDERKITRDEALELTECFWIKSNEIIKLRPWCCTRWFSGYPMYQALTIGGQAPDGRDSTNELSYLCLEATAEVKLPQPTVVVAVHSGTPKEFLLKCCETLVRHGGGLPTFFNGEVIVPLLTNIGVSLKDARNWAIVGCAESVVPAKFVPLTGADCQFNLLKILELALNNGVNPATGLQLCPENGDLTTFSSFNDVKEAYKKQVEFYVSLAPLLDTVTAQTYAELTPTPFLSTLIDFRIKIGRDVSEGGGPNYVSSNTLGHGIINVGNALAAIKKLVFEEKLITLSELKDALDANFEERRGEEIRQMLINKALKYGNDNDYVDLITTEVSDYVLNVLERYTPIRGGKYGYSLQTISANIPQGELVGATPDGRKAGEALADNISAFPGTDIEGPTGVLKSAAKFDHESIVAGTILNLKFHPTAVKGEDKLRKLAELIRTYFVDLKGLQVQFNIVFADTLRDAQENPDKYRGLMVKVAGYSAFFTTLDKKVQDQIMTRTEHGMW